MKLYCGMGFVGVVFGGGGGGSGSCSSLLVSFVLFLFVVFSCLFGVVCFLRWW